MIRLGTCAWNFEDWKDVFYPAGLASGQQLAYYAHYLPAVEIDSTFYHIPRLDVVAAWADKTPDDFVFTAKMPGLITHDARLRNCERELTAFLGSLRPMGEKLGAVLIQFSPFFNPGPRRGRPARFPATCCPPGEIPLRGRVPPPGLAHAAHRENAHRARRRLGPGTTSARSTRRPGRRSVLPAADGPDFLYVRLMGDLETKFRPDGERQFRYGSLLWPRDGGLKTGRTGSPSTGRISATSTSWSTTTTRGSRR